MNRIGIESLSVFGLPPVEHVNLAADLGCAHISAGLVPFGYNPQNYPAFSLIEDNQLRRDTMTAMRERGVSFSLGEGLTIRPGVDINTRQAEFEVMCELGVTRINAVSMDPDWNRTVDQFGAMADMAAKAGVEATVELSPGLTVSDLATAAKVVREVARPNFKLLLDTMHLFRSGATPKEVAALDPSMIGYIQAADTTKQPRIPSYMEEACFERMTIGTGEVPIRDFLAVMPRNLVIGIEAPIRSQAAAGIGPRERVAPSVEALRTILMGLDC